MMDTPEHKAVAIGIRNALYDMEDWPEQATIKTVTGRIIQRVCEQLVLRVKGFDHKLFTETVYQLEEFTKEDEDIPF